MNKTRFPHVLRIEPAGACNLRCRHCPTGTVEMPRGIMKWSTFETIVEQVEPHAEKIRVAVLYHGGEPFLNKDIFRMADVLRHKLNIGFIKTVSNGMLLDAKMREQLLSSCIDSIEISLDGQSPQENDAIRRGCNCSQVVSNVRELLQARNSQNEQLKVIIASTQIMNHQEVKSLNNPPPPQIPQYLLDAFDDVKPDEYKTTWAMRWPRMNVEPPLSVHAAKGIMSKFCDHLESTMTIRWDGNVVPCCYDLTNECIFGNIIESNIYKILNGDKQSDFRKSLVRGNHMKPCSECANIGFCLHITYNFN